jgi:hypothetical protein
MIDRKLDASTYTWVTTGLVVIMMGILGLYWTLFISINTKIESVRLDHAVTKTTLNNHINFKCEDNNEH